MTRSRMTMSYTPFLPGAINCAGKRLRQRFWSGSALAALTVTLATTASPAFAELSRAHANDLMAFNDAKVLTASELDKVRGGFDTGQGLFVQIGFEIDQFANNVLQNQVSVGPINIQGNKVTNTFTVTQTTANSGPTTTTLTQLPAGGLTALTNLNSNQTVLAVTVNNGSIQSLIQNQANNQALKNVTTVNVTTQGLINAIHNVEDISRINQMVHQWH